MSRIFWTQKQDIGPTGREVHRMAYDSNRQRIVLFGGRAGTSVVFNDTWVWDGEYWTQMNDLGPISSKRTHLGVRQYSEPNGLLRGPIQHFRP